MFPLPKSPNSWEEAPLDVAFLVICVYENILFPGMMWDCHTVWPFWSKICHDAHDPKNGCMTFDSTWTVVFKLIHVMIFKTSGGQTQLIRSLSNKQKRCSELPIAFKGECRKSVFNPWVGKIPWIFPLVFWRESSYSCLENSMDREAWWATVHGIAKRFNPWVGKIPWRREWQPTQVFLPGEFHGQSGLVGYSPWGS